MNISEQIESVLNGVKEAATTSQWAKGFDDCLSLKQAESSTGDYAKGYSYAYELGEKKSAN